MNEEFNLKIENPEPAAGGRPANPSWYLDRVSLTILMVMKLIAALTKLSIAVVCAVIINSVVSALNDILKEGTVSGKIMIAQILKTLRFPMENVNQAVAAVPSDFTVSSSLPLYAFMIFLPFVLISLLEAIGLIRLRLGKGGTRMVGIPQWIYFALDAIKLLALTLLAIVLSLLAIIRLGGSFGITIASIIFSLAVFFIPIRLPAMLYHRNIAGIMKDIRYEMKTGEQAVRRWINFRKILGFMIALELAGTIISLMAYWRPTQQDPAIMTLVMIIVYPALNLVRYICVMFFYRNFMQVDNIAEAKDDISQKPQLILVGLITLFFVCVSGFVCVKSASVSRAVVERASIFFNDAQKTVDQMSNQADQKINDVEQAIDSQADAIQQAIDSQTGTEGTNEAPQQTAPGSSQETNETPQQTAPDSSQETSDNPQEGTTEAATTPGAGTKEAPKGN